MTFEKPYVYNIPIVFANVLASQGACKHTIRLQTAQHVCKLPQVCRLTSAFINILGRMQTSYDVSKHRRIFVNPRIFPHMISFTTCIYGDSMVIILLKGIDY